MIMSILIVKMIIEDDHNQFIRVFLYFLFLSELIIFFKFILSYLKIDFVF